MQKAGRGQGNEGLNDETIKNDEKNAFIPENLKTSPSKPLSQRKIQTHTIIIHQKTNGGTLDSHSNNSGGVWRDGDSNLIMLLGVPASASARNR